MHSINILHNHSLFIAAVSYTHLDVYKRQVKGCAPVKSIFCDHDLPLLCSIIACFFWLILFVTIIQVYFVTVLMGDGMVKYG